MRFKWYPIGCDVDNEIDIEYEIHPGSPGVYYGDNPHLFEDATIEIISASEGGIPLTLAKHEIDMVVDAIWEAQG